MSAVDRRHARERFGGNPTNFHRPQRLPAGTRHPVSTWWPDNAHQAHRGPIYVSFVSKAILWDKGLGNDNAPATLGRRTALCPRFLSHMRAPPEGLGPPCLPSSKFRPRALPRGKTCNWVSSGAAKTQTLEGFFHLTPDRGRKGVQDGGSVARRCTAVVIPHQPLSPVDPPSCPNTPRSNSGRQNRLDAVRASPTRLSPRAPLSPPRGKKESPLPVVTSESWRGSLKSDGVEGPETPARSSSFRSVSDPSCTPSSLFSRSTDLASGGSGVFSDMSDMNPKAVLLTPLQPPPVSRSTLGSDPPAGSSPRPTGSAEAPPNGELIFGPTKPLPLRPISTARSASDGPREASNGYGNNLRDVSVDRPLDSDHGLATLAFPSATWSSCPSLQRTTYRSGSEGNLTPSPPVGQVESRRWPVLPPIAPVKGGCVSTASRSSDISCSQSHVFDEIEAVAPRSTSCLSLDRMSNSSGCSSPDNKFSPGLAALTVGCHSGDLGSLSRVRLLLLDRAVPENLQGPSRAEEDFSRVQNWLDMMTHDEHAPTPEGSLRPLTAGSLAEWCKSAGKVQENKSDVTEESTGSPSSVLVDRSPSLSMLRSSYSPCSGAATGSLAEEGSDDTTWKGQTEYSTGGRRTGCPTYVGEERDKGMEERRTKVLHLLSKLRDDSPCQPGGNKSCSNFDDFDFLAKYCIFSREKLAEYKRAFEAEDVDGDGYISCLQVLLALKTIIPPELLSEDEEIYVYRILEMVDFRVTDGLVDLRLFAVIASLAQKVASMDDFMRSLISRMDFRSLEVRLFKAKQLFLYLLEGQHGDVRAQRGFISAEQLLLELKVGGIYREQEEAVRRELQRIPPLDLLDFLAYLPLFMLIHKF